MADSSTQKSTIVRVLPWLFRILELAAPSVGARWANRIWFTIPRVPRRPDDLPPDGERFEVTSRGVTVRGLMWGSGPVVYVVHGWGGRGADLSAYVAPLVARGHRVVTFDAPSHGASDPGSLGPGRTHGVEFGRALDAVAARFGPAEAVVAHSMGAVVTLLTLRHGWLGTRRLVLLAPMSRLSTQLATFRFMMGIGPRIQARMDRAVEARAGLTPTGFEAPDLYDEVGPLPTLIVHDQGDRVTPYASGLELASRADARLVTTTGLGHYRLLRDSAIVNTVVDFVAPSSEEQEAAA